MRPRIQCPHHFSASWFMPRHLLLNPRNQPLRLLDIRRAVAVGRVVAPRGLGVGAKHVSSCGTIPDRESPHMLRPYGDSLAIDARMVRTMLESESP